MTEYRRDYIVALIACVLAIVYLIATYQLPVRANIDPLGPRAFPYLIGILIFLCGIGLVVETLVNSRSARPAGDDVDEPKDHRLLAVALVAVWTLLYYLLFNQLGYVLATIPFIFGLTAFFNRGKWVANILSSILFPLAINYILTSILGYAPAPGLLGF